MTRQQFDLMGGEAEEEGEVKPTVIAETKRTSQLKVIKAMRKSWPRMKNIWTIWAKCVYGARQKRRMRPMPERQHDAPQYRFDSLLPVSGRDLARENPKQYVEINGKTVLQYAIEIFEQHPRIDLIAVILSPEDSVFQTAPSEKVRVFRVGGVKSCRNGTQWCVRFIGARFGRGARQYLGS